MKYSFSFYVFISMVYIKEFLLIYNQVFSAKDERSDMKASMFMWLIHMMGWVCLL